MNKFPNEIIEEALICQAYGNLDADYKAKNMNSFLEYSYVPQYYKCQNNICNDNLLRFPKQQHSQICDEDIFMYRGQNNRPPRNFPVAQPFLVKPCQIDSYDNAVVCDDDKCCSKSTQLFCNMTKRSGSKDCKDRSGKITHPLSSQGACQASL